MRAPMIVCGHVNYSIEEEEFSFLFSFRIPNFALCIAIVSLASMLLRAASYLLGLLLPSLHMSWFMLHEHMHLKVQPWRYDIWNLRSKVCYMSQRLLHCTYTFNHLGELANTTQSQFGVRHNNIYLFVCQNCGEWVIWFVVWSTKCTVTELQGGLVVEKLYAGYPTWLEPLVDT